MRYSDRDAFEWTVCSVPTTSEAHTIGNALTHFAYFNVYTETIVLNAQDTQAHLLNCSTLFVYCYSYDGDRFNLSTPGLENLC